MTLKENRAAILALLHKEQRPLTRRYIEAVLVFEQGADANAVTKAVRELWRSGRIRKTRVQDFAGSDRADYDVYSFEKVSEGERNRLAATIHHSINLFGEDTLALSGERYVRSILRRTGLFKSITPRAALGHIPVPGHKRLEADVAATLRKSEIRIVVEVKNTREHWYPTKGVFGELMVKALSLDALPMFVAAHVSDEALSDCRLLGMPVLHLGKQIVPNGRGSSDMLIRAARSVIGPTPFELLNSEHPFKHGISPWSQSHIDELHQSDWPALQMQWQMNRQVAKQYAPILAKGIGGRFGNNTYQIQKLKEFQKLIGSADSLKQ